jgi:2-polyprenyl-6-methoxyphenol hydroxylase-like FAD-dependent oxidoreductase
MKKYDRLTVDITWHNMQQVLASLVLASLLLSNVVATGPSLLAFSEQQVDDSIVLQFENGYNVRATVALACDGVFSVARGNRFRRTVPFALDSSNWSTIIEANKLPVNAHPPNAVQAFSYSRSSEDADTTSIPRWTSYINDVGGGLTFLQFRVSDPMQAIALSGNKGRGGLGLPGIKQALLPLAQPSHPNVARESNL